MNCWDNKSVFQAHLMEARQTINGSFCLLLDHQLTSSTSISATTKYISQVARCVLIIIIVPQTSFYSRTPLWIPVFSASAAVSFSILHVHTYLAGGMEGMKHDTTTTTTTVLFLHQIAEQATTLDVVLLRISVYSIPLKFNHSVPLDIICALH